MITKKTFVRLSMASSLFLVLLFIFDSKTLSVTLPRISQYINFDDLRLPGEEDFYEDKLNSPESNTKKLAVVNDSVDPNLDTDGDGIPDIDDLDDDNDGIPDHVESPGCFLLASEVDMIEVTTSLTNYSTNTSYLFEELYDGVYDNMASFGSLNTPITGETVYEFVFAQPVPIKAFEVTHNYSIFKSGAKFKIQGYDGSAWIDLSGEIDGIDNTNSTNTYSISQNEGNYSRYRFYGISGNTDYNRIYEIDPIPSDSFNPSLFPKAECEDDFDGDGVFNHHDLDSDGDGCSDGVESGSLALSENSTEQFQTGTDTNGNGLLDRFTEDYAAAFSAYALEDSINACTDTDGDGITDVFDLDDDNDGGARY